MKVVVIGASAGGLDAIIALLSNIPLDCGIAFVFVQHLDPHHPSLSVEILSKAIPLKVEEVVDGTLIKLNCVYVMPSNCNIALTNGRLALSPRLIPPQQNLPIDIFFKSCAADVHHAFVGVILSGSGSDGSAGIAAIKQNGGVTFAQDPDAARYPDMPRNAIATGMIDYVLQPAEIADVLVGSRNLKSAVAPSASNVRSLSSVFAILRGRTKLDFSGYKQATMRRRVARRIALRRLSSIDEYVSFLQSNVGEIDALYEELLIHVTGFFRDPECYEELELKVYPKLVENRPADQAIRIWVAGCSTGEECYSIAMSLLDFLSERDLHHSIQIFATDASAVSLRQARDGVYSESSLEAVSAERRKKYFERTESGYRIKKGVRNLCLFTKHDFLQDAPFAKLDLVTCRNVMIYFSAALQRKVLPVFHFALKPSGFLWLGRAENASEQLKLFKSTSRVHGLYSKLPNAKNHGYEFVKRPLIAAHDTLAGATAAASPLLSRHAVEISKFEASAKFVAPSIVANSVFDVLQIRGDLSNYLSRTESAAKGDVLMLVRAELRSELRRLLQATRKTKAPCLSRPLQFEKSGQSFACDLEVITINPAERAQERAYLILFKETSLASKIKRKLTASDQKKTPTQRRLERELREIKGFQQSLVEQYESSQFELLNANQELQSANEEFVSANEEVETAKEELQSANEELVTVNDELQIRNNDLTKLTGDLNNLLASIELPVLIVDGEHLIRRYSPAQNNPFNLISTDIGRSITDIRSNFNLEIGALVDEVTHNQQAKNIEVQDQKGRWQRMQIRPYKTVEGQFDGAIITLVDINLLKQNELKSSENLQFLTAVAETVPIALAVVTEDLLFQSSNRSFHEFFGDSTDKVGQELFSSFSLSGLPPSELKAAIADSTNSRLGVKGLEVTYDGKTLGQDLGQRTILLAGGKIRGVKPSLETVLLSFTDVTEARSLQDQSMRLLLREQEARALADRANRAKDIFLATLSHELRTPLSSIMTWSQLIARGKVDFDKAKEGARVIEQSAYVQTQLIDDLLDVSRIIAGKLSLDIQEVDPVYVMQLAIQAIGSMSEKKNVLIEFESHVDQCFILADPIRLQQIFWNLLINAVKFSHLAGKITVKIEFLEQIKRRFVKMQVIDRGNGIPVDFLPHIFARFIQADSAPARTHGGLGLGLSIVENLVHLHGGFVSAANASVGRGAVFTLQFPIVMHPESIIVRSSEQASQGREQIESAKSAPSLNGLNILFVDDDENAREAVAIYLRSFGAAVVALGSAAEAMAELGEKLPDIIISDIAMPSEDGYSFIGRVRALSVGQGGRTPAIALTAYVTKDDAKRALDAGFQAHLSKPVDAHQLGRVIALLLKRTLN